MLFSMIATTLVSHLLTAPGQVPEIVPLSPAPSNLPAVAQAPGGKSQTLQSPPPWAGGPHRSLVDFKRDGG